MNLASLIKKNAGFFIPYFILLFTGLLLNMIYTQKTLFFFINKPFDAGIEDPFMFWYTNVGDGLFALAVSVLLLFWRIRYALISGIAFLLQGLLVQLFKQVLFTHNVRPWEMYKATNQVHLVEDFLPFSNNSFPSGHTATAFAMFALLALFVSNKRFGPVFFLLALLVGFARIYLAQHFFIDTYVGSIIGVFSAVLIYSYFYNPKSKINRSSWLDLPLHKLRR